MIPRISIERVYSTGQRNQPPDRGAQIGGVTCHDTVGEPNAAPFHQTQPDQARGPRLDLVALGGVNSSWNSARRSCDPTARH